ncbi:hypothetical protein [Lacibacter sediminis]|uniref:Uncharacterized protein n=1 Tax=Lacibacter sediminis TaxID=2760713 RepID=A0A7G5XBH3_9BACT|nr:hypothetical protein [Lacibacter sediminis]QNA42826.1 hypothetical protein H4075_12040 [Lacibacter sediminis]
MPIFLILKGLIVAIGIIIPSYQLIVNKEKKGVHRINGFGWLLICFAILTGLVSIIEGISNKNSNRPILDVLTYDRPNPILVKDSLFERYQFIASVGTLTDEMAYKIKEKFVLINAFKGGYVIGGSTTINQANESIILEKQTALRFSSEFWNDIRQPKTDSCYYFLKVDYENESGDEQKPLRKIYGFTLMDVKKPIYEVNSHTYQLMKKILIKENQW